MKQTEYNGMAIQLARLHQESESLAIESRQGVETGRGVGAGCNLSCMPPIQFDSIQIEMLFNYR